MQDADIAQKIRVDKWLWQARFFKTRSVAAKQVSAGHVRLNTARISKPSTMVKPGDVLTFAQAREIRVIKILHLGVRRGPAPEAQTLYEDLDPPKPRTVQDSVLKNPGYDGKGRPTKKARRNLDLNRSSALD